METRRRRAERIPEKKVKTKNKKKHRGLKIFGLIVLLIALIGGLAVLLVVKDIWMLKKHQKNLTSLLTGKHLPNCQVSNRSHHLASYF